VNFKAWLKKTFCLFFQAIGFSFFIAPKKLADFGNFFSFLCILLFSCLPFVIADYFVAGESRMFFSSGINTYAFIALAILFAAFLAAYAIHRKVLWLNIASTLTVSISIWTGTWMLCEHFLPKIPINYGWKELCFALFCLGLLRYLYRLGSPPHFRYALGALGVIALVCYWPWQQQLYNRIWFALEPEGVYEEVAQFEVFEAETVFAHQADLLKQQVSALIEQRPNTIDLYAIGMAADGHENVFRNEVLFLEKLLSARFDNQNRFIHLINTFETTEKQTLATARNLNMALSALSSKMDKQEDILLLYVTTHGGRDHQLSVQLSNLPMTQIRPEQLDAFLDQSQIKHQIIVISACYSGGFIEPLKNENRMIITAASKDRTSFGCGAESEITWFGNAFWAKAMNETRDFEKAFIQARSTIAGWEKREKQTPSQPQIYVGNQMRKHLAIWQTQLPEKSPKVAFKPSPIKPIVKVQPAAIDSSSHH
jgi:Peptidase C13 family